MDAVAYWTAQQTYRKELAVARAAANKSPPSSSGSGSSSSSVSASSSLAVSSLDLANFRPGELIIMEAKPTVPQVRAHSLKIIRHLLTLHFAFDFFSVENRHISYCELCD
jgi:hypothetical protein